MSSAAERWRPLRVLSDRAASLVGLPPAEREALVLAMLERFRTDRVEYWFQLTVAMGIATLGLVLDSNAVVIGAMLVSPLMAPIVSLGMSLATGSPDLALRAAWRVLLSVGVVVSGSALLSRALPLHQLTAELSARTSPTLLDLCVAAFCALIASYSTARPKADGASTAAGAAIGIALVPPLCVVGFGLAEGRASVANGAALLFTANFTAIVFVSVLLFVLLGFDMVDGRSLAEGGGRQAGPFGRIAATLRHLFGSAYGPALRFLLPLAFVALLFLPLRRALQEVTWQVRARSSVEALLREVAPPERAVRTTLTVSQRTIVLGVVLVDRADHAAQLEAQLRQRIHRATGVTPSLHVSVVPDFASLREFAESQPPPVPAAPTTPRAPDLEGDESWLAESLRAAWPESAAGPLLAWSLVGARSGVAELRVLHLGAPLGAAGTTLLQRELARRTEADFALHAQALSPEASVAPRDGGARWLSSLVRALDAVSACPSLRACVELPAPSPQPLASAAPRARARAPLERERELLREAHLEELRAAALALLREQDPARVERREGEAWSVRLTQSGCASQGTP